MMLKSFGCSFIFGSDLLDVECNRYTTTGSAFTWPALLAKDLNYDYCCYARPGIGNLQILERLLNQIANNDDSYYVINWTWIDRFDYINSQDTSTWDTIVPANTNNISTMYYKHLHNQYYDKLTTLLYIKLAIDTLTQAQRPFIMTYIDELIFETKWHTSPAIIELQNYIRPYLITFDNQTFLEWTKEKGFPISETLHPLEEAHQAAFELIKSYNLV